MTTPWKKLTRNDLTTFDKFGTNAVLTAMDQGGIGRIGANGHVQIRGVAGTLSISRDNSAPHCQGNVTAALERAFPALKAAKTSVATIEKDTIMATKTDHTKTDTAPEVIECPAKGCDEKFATLGEANAHVHSEHAICTWEGCDWGPNGGPYIGVSAQAIGGHTNTRHRGFKLHEQNRDKAATKRAATFAAKKKARIEASRVVPVAKQASVEVGSFIPDVDLGPTESNGHLSNIEAWADQAGATRVVEPVKEVAAPATDGDAEAKLALIREILGDDVEVAQLKKEVADLKAHLALVREAVGLDFGDEDDTN